MVVFHQTVHQRSLVGLLDALPLALRALLQTGYSAVGIFFVLSGFVLAYSCPLSEGFDRDRRRRFWVARWARVYPVYLLGLLLFAPFAAYPPREGGAAKLWFDSAVLALNLGCLQAWIPQLALSWNFPGWSLSNEAFFYATFPFLGPRLWRCGSLGSVLGGMAGLWLIVLGLPVWSLWDGTAGMIHLPTLQADTEGPQPLTNFLNFHPLVRIAEFLVGVLCAKAYFLRRGAGWEGRGGILTSLGFIGIGVAIGNADRLPYARLHNGLLLPAVVLLLLGLALGGGWLANLLSARPMVFLGNASDALYITHIPVAFYLTASGWFSQNSLYYFAAYLCLAILASCAIYVWLEDPLNQYLRQRFR